MPLPWGGRYGREAEWQAREKARALARAKTPKRCLSFLTHKGTRFYCKRPKGHKGQHSYTGGAIRG